MEQSSLKQTVRFYFGARRVVRSVGATVDFNFNTVIVYRLVYTDNEFEGDRIVMVYIVYIDARRLGRGTTSCYHQRHASLIVRAVVPRKKSPSGWSEIFASRVHRC